MRFIMVSLGHPSFPPKDLGRLNDEEASPRVSDHGRHIMSSSPVTLNTHHVGEQCTLNLSRAQTSSHWCVVVVQRGGASSGVVRVT
ncbi:hypothetical protein TNCV_3188751 [Trichonephila clavipes]|nr:hypothetical protein TNCV_3188751 [Trichonephila clavipes]